MKKYPQPQNRLGDIEFTALFEDGALAAVNPLVKYLRVERAKRKW